MRALMILCFALALAAGYPLIPLLLRNQSHQVISDSRIKTEKGDIAVTVSLGVTSMASESNSQEYRAEGIVRDKDILRDESTQDWAALLNRADQAMYMAKSTGRNCVVAK